MSRLHQYETVVTWTGNTGTGTSGYRAYERAHEITTDGRAPIAGSSDPSFRGDPARWNPEQLLVASLSQCHLLWYLHLCSDAGVVVVDYVDEAVGTMVDEGTAGHFTEVILRPRVQVAAPEMIEAAIRLHDDAHRACYVASSVNFPVRHTPQITTIKGISES